MTYLELFTSAPAPFGGIYQKLEDADYVVIGVPFDGTSSYRPGSRFAPLAIREASLNIETYSFRTGIDLEDLKIHDAGDLHVTGDVTEMLRRLELVVCEVLDHGKTPVIIGGEHTVALGSVKGVRKESSMLSFDAHLDLRDQYMGQSVCHATFMRRINETVKPSKVVEVGTRAACREEIRYAKEREINYITSHRITQAGAGKTAKDISKLLTDCDQLYVSVDMDVLDPAFAPAVQNPEPEGLSTPFLLDLLSKMCSSRILGFDVTEVTPHYDNGITAIQAARVICEIISYIHRDKR